VHGIPHGITSCLLLPHAMRYQAPHTAAKQARIAAALGVDTRGLSEAKAAARAADAVAGLIAHLGQPQHLAAYHLDDAALQTAASGVEGYAAADLLAILHAAR
jgi:alcohol dehydrogenase class IV